VTNFERCLAFTVGSEGGYVNDPNDPGGETKFGISKRQYPDLDIALLTAEDASEIYHDDYWVPMHCDDIPGPLAMCVFDEGVNTGQHEAVLLLQRAVGAQPTDGKIGPNTIAQANRYILPSAIYRFADEREKYYRSLPTFPRYGRGWLLRSDKCRDMALAWAREGVS
jgi:lysozyme family protein